MLYRRILKQIIYGALYLLIIYGLFYALYTAGFKPEASCFDGKKNQGEQEVDCGGPCKSCAINRLSDIQASPVAVIPSPIQGQSSALFEFKNPNPHFGANRFNYTLRLFDSGDKLLEEIKRESFIYPGEVKTIFESDLSFSTQTITRTEVIISDLSWIAQEQFSRPQTQIRNLEVRVEGEDSLRPTIIVGATLRNENAFKLSRTDIVAKLRDNLSAIAAVSRTRVENLAAFGEKDFEILIPVSPSQLDTLELDPEISLDLER